MNVFQYVDQIKLRLNTINVGADLDDLSLLSYINTARKKVQYNTLSIYPERYGVMTEIELDPPNMLYYNYTNEGPSFNPILDYVDVYRVPLPFNFIDAVSVKLAWTISSEGEDTDYEYEARRITRAEFFSTTYHAHNRATIYSPLYTIVREEGAYNLYFTTLKDGPNFVVGPRLALWHTALIADLSWEGSQEDQTLGDREKCIPVEVEDLVVLYAIELYLQQINLQPALQLIRSEIQELLTSLQPIYQMDKAQDTVNLSTQQR